MGSRTCGGGSTSRTRRVISHAAAGLYKCPKLVDTESCNSVECADDCKVTLWSPWSECDVSCGGEGIQHRHRTIIVPSRRGGRRCPPLMRETQPCGEELCMADCIMSDWS